MSEKAFEWTSPGGQLLQHKIEDDDPLWLVTATEDEVKSLVQHPYCWVNCLNGRRDKEFDIFLPDQFLIRMNLSLPTGGGGSHVGDQVEELRENDGDGTRPFIVQGISGTGVILIRPRHLQSPLIDNPKWHEYWTEWNGDCTKMKVTKSPTYRQGFAHLELAPAKIDASTRADRITAFLMYSAGAKTLQFSGAEELYLNLILLKQAEEHFDLDQKSFVKGPKTHFKKITGAEIKKVNFTYSGREMDLPDRVTEFAATTVPACDDKAGTLVEQDIVLDEVIVKNYVARPEDRFRRQTR